MTIEITQQPPAALEIDVTQVNVETTQTPPLNLTVEEAVTSIEVLQQPAVTLEINNGPRGPIGPTGNPTISAEADETIAPGQPVWVKSTTHVGLARANAQATARVGGIAVTAANATHSVDYVTDGVLELVDWTDVIGATSLTPGATYYLSAAFVGLLTITAPTATGFVVAVGRALNTTTLDIEISQPVRL